MYSVFLFYFFFIIKTCKLFLLLLFVLVSVWVRVVIVFVLVAVCWFGLVGFLFYLFSQPTSYNQQASCLTTTCALSAVPPLQANLYCNAMRPFVVVVAVPPVRPDFGFFLAGT
jgi:hypothetical protein